MNRKDIFGEAESFPNQAYNNYTWMSIQVRCFEGFNIKRCVCSWAGCCKSAEPGGGPEPSSSKTQTHIMMIQDIGLDLTVVSAPHRFLHTLGEETSPEEEPWDFMTVDKDRRLVMLVGERFLYFANDPSLSIRPDACRKKLIDDVFPRGVMDIFNPLLSVALCGKGGQLHSIYKGHGLTFFAFPLFNETRQIIGAHVIYRPTRYNQADIAKLISQGTQAAAAAPLNLRPTPEELARAARAGLAPSAFPVDEDQVEDPSKDNPSTHSQNKSTNL